MITKKSKYAIKALIFLAKKYQKGPILIGEISEAERIPKKFLEAILLDLKKAGILGSKMGKGGGYYLLKTPEDVTLVDVYRLFDGAISLVSCVSLKFYERCEECEDEAICGIRDVFLDIRNETLRIMKGSTLQDLLQREIRLDQQRGAQ